MAKPGLKAEAVRLRVQERLSLGEILDRVPVSKGSLSLWLRPYPLTDAEMSARRRNNAPPSQRKDRGVESDLHRLVVGLGVEQTSAWKGRVAEAAILLRLVLHGFEPLRAVFEGDHVDMYARVSRPGQPDRIARLQVRWAYHPRVGVPVIDLRCWDGKRHKRYIDDTFDFVVGYDLFTDTAYVFSWAEIRSQGAISVHPDASESWQKINSL